MTPWSALSSPAPIFSNVLFPHPLRPKRTVIFPSYPHTEADFKTLLPPNDLLIESAANTGREGTSEHPDQSLRCQIHKGCGQ